MVEEVPEVEEVQTLMVLEAEKVQEIRNGFGDLRLLRLGSCGIFAVLEYRDVQDLKILEGMYVISKIGVICRGLGSKEGSMCRIFENCCDLRWLRPPTDRHDAQL